MSLDKMSTSSQSALDFEKLTQNNYHTWKIPMSGLLRREGLWRVVTGRDLRLVPLKSADETEDLGPAPTAPDSSTQDKLDAWDDKNDKAVGTITMAVSPGIQLQLINIDGAKEVWEKLKSLFEIKTESNRLMLKETLFRNKLSEGESVQEYINRMQVTVNQLAAISDPVSDSDQAAYLLFGLPESFENFHLTFDNVDDENLTSALVIQRLIGEDKRRTYNEENKSSVKREQALIVHNTAYSGRRWDPKKPPSREGSCNYCKKP
jgi:hypothetical protein